VLGAEKYSDLMNAVEIRRAAIEAAKEKTE
jgi:hypothetical protein